MRLRRVSAAKPGPVEQFGVLATLSRWRPRVQIPSGPQQGEGPHPARGAGLPHEGTPTGDEGRAPRGAAHDHSTTPRQDRSRRRARSHDGQGPSACEHARDGGRAPRRGRREHNASRQDGGSGRPVARGRRGPCACAPRSPAPDSRAWTGRCTPPCVLPAVLTHPSGPRYSKKQGTAPCGPPGGGVWRHRLGTRHGRRSAHTCRPRRRTGASPATAPSTTAPCDGRRAPYPAPRTPPGRPGNTSVPTPVPSSAYAAGSTSQPVCDGCHPMSFRKCGTYTSPTTSQFNMCNCTTRRGPRRPAHR